jgi:hypothetical protein
VHENNELLDKYMNWSSNISAKNLIRNLKAKPYLIEREPWYEEGLVWKVFEGDWYKKDGLNCDDLRKEVSSKMVSLKQRREAFMHLKKQLDLQKATIENAMDVINRKDHTMPFTEADF